MRRAPIRPETQQWLLIAETTLDDQERLHAIDEVAAGRDPEASRELVELYVRSVWQSTRIAIVRALGALGQRRGIDFLLKLARDHDYLGVASEAVLALGATHSMLAGEVVVGIARDNMHPLQRDALVALTNLDIFPCDEVLRHLLAQADELPGSTLQNLVLALGRRSVVDAWPKVQELFDSDVCEHNEGFFHALLLVTGLIADASALALLAKQHTLYRSFAHPLRLSAEEHIRERAHRSIEDAVGALLHAKSFAAQLDAARFLRHYGHRPAFDAFLLLGGEEASPPLQCVARTLLIDQSHDDLGFVLTFASQLPVSHLAALARARSVVDSGFLPALRAQLPRATVVGLMNELRDSAAIPLLLEIVADAGADAALRVQAVNALVAQVQMAGVGSSEEARVVEGLVAQLSVEQESPLGQRLIRALGQLQWSEEGALFLIEKILRNNRTGMESVFRALADIGSPDAARVLLRRLKSEDHVQHALAALGSFEVLPDTEPLLPFVLSFDGTMRRAAHAARLHSLLRILTHNVVVGGDQVVLLALSSADYETQMFALTAARLNHNEAVWQRLYEVAQGSALGPSVRAIYSLCSGGTRAQHQWVVEQLVAKPSLEFARRVVRNLEPEPLGDYGPCIALLDGLIEQRDEPAERELLTTLVGLRDNLVVAGQGVRRPTTRELAKLSEPMGLIDQGMSQTLPAFAGYSDQVKAALRNAELTFQHPELFDETVDKSTMVVEYVKAIELYLQERLGAQFMQSAQRGLLTMMQSRIVRLHLDDPNYARADLVRDLDCDTHFGVEAFPSYKLVGLCRSISTGRILHDQSRAIDGLRAWALLLLIFGRRFMFHKALMQPLFKMVRSDNEVICKVAKNLVQLQEIRNEVAHHGTMLRLEQVSKVRAFSFKALIELHELIEPAEERLG